MSASQPQPVYPWPPAPAHVELLKQARAALGADVLFVEAHYGSPGRVICFGDTPPWLTPTAPIQAANTESLESVTAALKFAMSDSDAFKEDWLLSKWFGAPVRQVGVEEHAGGVRFV